MLHLSLNISFLFPSPILLTPSVSLSIAPTSPASH